MSASLVGSEMCIRDRASPARAGSVFWVCSGGRKPAREGASNCRKRCYTCSVSYTHLTLPTICSV
eukprot:10005526-Alexandrium_andersonii.AAC.1